MSVRAEQSRGGRPYKGDRVFVPARAPKGLVDHVVRVAESQGLTQNAYLCTLLEDLHGFPRSEVDQVGTFDIVPASPVPHTGTTSKLRCRLGRSLAEHIDDVARRQGMERAPYLAALVAQAHGFDVARRVTPRPFQPAFTPEPLPALAATGS